MSYYFSKILLRFGWTSARLALSDPTRRRLLPPHRTHEARRGPLELVHFPSVFSLVFPDLLLLAVPTPLRKILLEYWSVSVLTLDASFRAVVLHNPMTSPLSSSTKGYQNNDISYIYSLTSTIETESRLCMWTGMCEVGQRWGQAGASVVECLVLLCFVIFTPQCLSARDLFVQEVGTESVVTRRD